MRLIQRLRKRVYLESTWVALGIFTIVSIIFCHEFFRNFNYWGQMDWDQFTFWNAVSRKTIIDYHQFPLWNPYANGGNVLLAHPHSGFLSPFFIFVLIFGPIIGLKLEICVFLFLGLLGMFYLARFFKIKGASLYLPSFIFMLNSIFPLHLTEGHVEYLPMALIPWIFLFVLKSKKDLKFAGYATISLSLMIFSGSIYPLIVFLFFLTFYLFSQYLKTRNSFFLKILLLLYGGSFLLCSIKIFPMLEFVAKNPRIVTERDGVSLSLLFKMLTDRSQVAYDILNWKPTGIYEWHEYGAYVGILSIILFLVGITIYFKKHWPLILSSFLALLFIFGNKLYVDFWDILHKLPIFRGLSTATTFMLGFILGFSIISGLGLYKIECILNNRFRKQNFISLITAIVVLSILLDLILVNSKIFHNAFVIKPVAVEPMADFCQIQGEVLDPRSRSSMYPAFLKNCGVVNGYEVMSVKKGKISIYPENLRTILSKQIIPQATKSYTGFVYLNNQKGRVQLDYFSPNVIKVTSYTPEDDFLVINQNFYGGWRIKEPGYKAFSYNGLIATKITAGAHRLTFYYLPSSFLIGVAISCTTLVSIFCSYFKHKRPK